MSRQARVFPKRELPGHAKIQKTLFLSGKQFGEEYVHESGACFRWEEDFSLEYVIRDFLPRLIFRNLL